MKIQSVGHWLIGGAVLLVGCGPKAIPEGSESATTESESIQSTSAESESSEAASVADEPSEDPAVVEFTLPNLGEQLTALSTKNKAMMPAEIVQVFVDGIKEVQGTGIVEAALSAGAEAFDGELPDANGNTVKLSDLWAKGPVVVVWYRGGWCPYCNLQLQAMQEALPAIKAKGGTLVAITPETPDNSLSTVEKNELEFVVLSDVGNELAKKYGVVFELPEKVSPIYKKMIDLAKYNGNDSDELPLAATYVINQTGKITYAFLDANYTKRAEPADIVAALEAL